MKLFKKSKKKVKVLLTSLALVTAVAIPVYAFSGAHAHGCEQPGYSWKSTRTNYTLSKCWNPFHGEGCKKKKSKTIATYECDMCHALFTETISEETTHTNP